jgi:hypothetical protein
MRWECGKIMSIKHPCQRVLASRIVGGTLANAETCLKLLQVQFSNLVMTEEKSQETRKNVVYVADCFWKDFSTFYFNLYQQLIDSFGKHVGCFLLCLLQPCKYSSFPCQKN